MKDKMMTTAAIWEGETVLERLDRCRKFLYGQGVVSREQNAKIRGQVEKVRDREIMANRDDMEMSDYLFPEPERESKSKLGVKVATVA